MKQKKTGRAQTEWQTFVKEFAKKNKNRSLKAPDAAPHCVTVFGGGVAGLTAAHELVERGFRVQLWEPVNDERDPSRGCDVGGMARSQWSKVEWDENIDVASRASITTDWSERQTKRIKHLPWVFYLDAPSGTLVGAIGERSAHWRPNPSDEIDSKFKEIIAEMMNSLFAQDNLRFYCEIQRRVPSEKLAIERVREVIARLKPFIESIATIKLRRAVKPYKESLVALAREIDPKDGRVPKTIEFYISLIDEFPEGLPDFVGERISFRVRERWIPGEHGFRFFPAFYRHLFDTMKRTPLLEPGEKSTIASSQERAVTVNANDEKYVETGRSVFDNLRPTTKQVISLPRAIGPTVLSRSLPKSFEELREWIRIALESRPEDEDEDIARGERGKIKGGFGFKMRDLALFQLKMLQYLTSCEKRRDDYSHMTWLEFLGGESAYSERFIEILDDIPQALVAMNARVSDARTQGSVFAQLLLDNIKPDGYRDGTLVGPTSVAWLTPWRRYLEAQGVEFIHGEIIGFEAVTGPSGNEQIVWPQVNCYEPRYPNALDGRPALMPGYFVLALPPLALRRVAARFLSACGDAKQEVERGSDIALAAEFLPANVDEDLKTPTPKGPLRHMIGIQYYFDEDIYWRDGHFYFPLSEWGISAISQVRFWQDKHDWEHGYRGVLSVVFTVLKNDKLEPKKANLFDHSPSDIAKAIWESITKSLPDKDLPQPRYWHLDFGFEKEKESEPYSNSTPLLINIPGQWETRPGGELRWITDEDIKPQQGEYSSYKVEQGVVLAGTIMKTHTRLTTMEAANESARHAVNAILKHAQALKSQRGKADTLELIYTPCDIWPLELHEVDDFKFLKEVDAELFARGLDHFVEILDLDKVVQTSLRGDRKRSRDPLDPLAVLSQLDRILKSLKTGFTSVIREHNKVVP